MDVKQQNLDVALTESPDVVILIVASAVMQSYNLFSLLLTELKFGFKKSVN